MVFHRSLRDNKSFQVSRTLLSILADLNNAVVWMVSSRLVISKSSSPCTNPLVTVPRAPITIDIIVTFMFHSFFNSLARLMYLSLFSHSFNFILWSTGTAKSTVLQVLFFLFFFEHIPFVCMVKLQLAQFPIDHLAHPDVPSLMFFLCKFDTFAYYVINSFISFAA